LTEVIRAENGEAARLVPRFEMICGAASEVKGARVDNAGPRGILGREDTRMDSTRLQALGNATAGLRHFKAGAAADTGASPGLVVSLEGNLDANAAAIAMDPFIELVEQWDGAPRMVVALEGLAYIASTGVGMLSLAAATAHKRGIALSLRRPQPAVLNVLKLLGITGFIPTDEGAGEAL